MVLQSNKRKFIKKNIFIENHLEHTTPIKQNKTTSVCFS